MALLPVFCGRSMCYRLRLWCFPDSAWRLIISIPVAVIGLTIGVLWERRAF